MNSLRQRLMLTILVPMVALAVFLIWMRHAMAVRDVSELFDRTLGGLTMAVARDLDNAEAGDGLSEATLQLLREAWGGDVFYHASDVGGYFVSGYAYPPHTPTDLRGVTDKLVFFDGQHRGEPVRVARLAQQKTIHRYSLKSSDMTGLTAVTVWQPMARRDEYVWNSVKQAALAVAVLLVALALLLWFSIGVGLRPLTRLASAVGNQSPDDLSAVQEPVPQEATVLVERINDVFAKLRSTIESQGRFISNAAHQLKNPVAGLVLMAEATANAKTDAERLRRSQELVKASQSLMRVSNQMLSLERARHFANRETFVVMDLNAVAREACTRLAVQILNAGVNLDFEPSPEPAHTLGDPLMIEECVVNLISNALNHAGPHNTHIVVSVRPEAAHHLVVVRDHGLGLPNFTFERFGQLDDTNGTGLGLPIVQEIMAQHEASVRFRNATPGAEVTLVFARAFL